MAVIWPISEGNSFVISFPPSLRLVTSSERSMSSDGSEPRRSFSVSLIVRTVLLLQVMPYQLIVQASPDSQPVLRSQYAPPVEE